MRRASGERSPSALRNRNFALLWSGQTISVVGNGLFLVALPLEVLQISNSPLNLALVISAQTIPSVLLLLIGGTLVDRLSRRVVMLVSDSVRGTSVLLLAALVARHDARLWEFIVLAVVFGSADAFFLPASTAIAPDILPAELLVSGSSYTTMSHSLGQYLAGPLLGGITVAILGTAWAFTIDAMSFFVSACCLIAMRVVTAIQSRAQKSTLLGGVREGLRYSRSQPWLWWGMTAAGFANLVSFAPLGGVLQPLLVRHVFRGGAVLLGVMYAANGVGGGLAAMYVSRRGAPRRRVTAILTSWAAGGLAAALVGLSPWPWMAAFFVAAMWFGVTYGNVLWFPLMQEEIPGDLLGRVSSVDWLLSLALSPLGVIAGGIAAGLVGVRLTVVVGGALAAASCSVILLPGVRRPDQRPRPGRSPEGHPQQA
jgi:MFS family permease